jgi:acyl dehydratase
VSESEVVAAKHKGRAQGGEMTAFDLSKIGKWSTERRFVVERSRIRDYAAATNDSNPSHLSGSLAPPVLAVVPATEVYPAQIEQLFGRPLSDLGSVHGEHDVHIATPLTPGMALRTKATVIGLRVKPTGTTVTIKTESREDQGEVVNTQFAVQFLRGFDAGASVGESPPAHALPPGLHNSDPFAQLRYRVDEDQSQRYAEASGDYGAYTVDQEAAREAGFPRPILHGVCTMAFGGRAIVESVCGGDSRRLKRLAVRFSSVLFPGQDIYTTLWKIDERGGLVIVAFEIADSVGTVVISNGLAEVTL